jgi:hypothetical protein
MYPLRFNMPPSDACVNIMPLSSELQTSYSSVDTGGDPQ